MFHQVAVYDQRLYADNSSSEKIGVPFVLSFTPVAAGETLVCYHQTQEGVIGEGRPLSTDDAVQLVSSAASNRKVDPWVNQRLLYQSSQVLCWYRPASKKPEPMWFRQSGQIKLMVLYPTLVFVKSEGLRVYAALTRHVDRNTKLYHAPLCNVNDCGSLCFGSADRPSSRDSVSQQIATCEAAIFETNFSHTSGSKSFRGAYGTEAHIAKWRQLADAGKAPSTKDLYSTGFTVESVVDRQEK